MFAAILRASSLVSRFAAPVGMFHRRKKAACGRSCEVYAFLVEPKARFPLASLRFDSPKDVAFGNCNIAWGDKGKAAGYAWTDGFAVCAAREVASGQIALFVLLFGEFLIEFF
jgi:hypothetical protein